MPCICLLRLTFLEDIFCHELHCLPKPVRSVGVFYLLFWHASWFYECCILNEISVNPFHCSQGWRFLKRSLEIVISLCCCFRSIHTQAWKKGSWKLVIIWWWSGHPSVAWSTSRAGGYVTSCSIYMKQQWDKCRGSLWQTQSWHCICKLLEHGYKKGHNKVCEHLAIYFEGAECPGCALLFPLMLQWAISVTTLSTELEKNPCPAVMPRPICALQLWKDYREQSQSRVEDLSLQIRPHSMCTAARTDAVSSSCCPPCLSLPRTPTWCFQVCLTAPAVWNDTYS